MAKKKVVTVVLPEPVIIDKSIGDHINESYVEFGNYVNQKRHMPHMRDGLKPSYRRMIYTALTFPDRMGKVGTLTGECGGKYSPHAPDSLDGVASELVHAGIFEGQGSHGAKSIYKPWNIPPAAARYCEAKMDSRWRKVIEPVLGLVEKQPSDMGYEEPLYIPSPIPISLLFGSLGLGIGIRSKIPTFSFKSMIEAYEADNPKLLQPNGDIMLNKRKSELEKLWTEGKGKVSYMFFIDENATSLDGVSKGYTLYGDPRFFQANLTENLEGNKDKGIQGWIDRDLVIMRDESAKKSKTKKVIFFGVKPKQKIVTNEMLRAELEIIRYNQETFKLAISDGNCTEVTPLRNWIGACYNNYNSLVAELKKRKSLSLALKKEVILHAEIVVDHIRANPKDKVEAISKALSLDLELTKEITKKSISVLMNMDKEKELESLAKQKAELELLEARDYFKDLLV